jgi:hypothetical protein
MNPPRPFHRQTPTLSSHRHGHRRARHTPWRSPAWARLIACLIAVAFSCLALTPATAATAPPRTADHARPGGPVVLIGIPALQWSDLSPAASPILWRLATRGAIATLSVRTIGTRTCPMDGWLTVSAGARAAQPHVPCGQLPPDPVRNGDGWTSTAVPNARQANLRSNFRGAVGSLGDAVHHAGQQTAAIGAGAALAAADSHGNLDAYAPTPASFTGWGRYRVTIVDLENIEALYLNNGTTHPGAAVTPAARAAAVRQADDQVGQILTAIPPGTNAIVAGVADHSTVPQLRVVIGHGPAFTAGHLLRSASTRRDGMTILPDVTATMLTTAGIAIPAQVVGIAWTPGRGHTTLTSAVVDLASQDTAAQAIRRTITRFFAVFVICQLAVYAIAALSIRRPHRHDRRAQDPAQRRGRRMLATARILTLAGAAIPVSTYLVNLLPWWQASQPILALYGGIAVIDAVLVALALAGPWRRDIMIPGTLVAGVTAIVAGTDLFFGSQLQMNSLMGYSPLVGGRYYGLGNIAFATFATGTLFFAAGLAHLLLRSGHRKAAVATVIILGATADLISGSPGLGAKFGGTIALIPGTAVTALIVAGRKVTPLRVLAFAALGVATIATICYLDYLRPRGQRTHLGRFAAQLADGEARPVITRKMLAMLHTVGNIPLTLLVAAGLLFLFTVLLRTRNTGPLAAAYQHAPALRAGLTGTLVTSMSGFAVEDSGIAVPAIALTLAVPLTFTAVARTLQKPPEPATPVDSQMTSQAEARP